MCTVTPLLTATIVLLAVVNGSADGIVPGTNLFDLQAEVM